MRVVAVRFTRTRDSDKWEKGVAICIEESVYNMVVDSKGFEVSFWWSIRDAPNDGCINIDLTGK